MTNRGVAPVDPTTNVGKVRLNVGDLTSVPLVPDEPGFGDYTYFGDAELQGFLDQSAGDPIRATGYAYLQFAAVFIAQGKSIKTDDLAIDTRSRGTDMLAVAKSWFAQADAADAAGASEFFDIASPYSVPCVGF